MFAFNFAIVIFFLLDTSQALLHIEVLEPIKDHFLRNR